MNISDEVFATTYSDAFPYPRSEAYPPDFPEGLKPVDSTAKTAQQIIQDQCCWVQNGSLFFRLPREIRDQIYDLLLPAPASRETTRWLGEPFTKIPGYKFWAYSMLGRLELSWLQPIDFQALYPPYPHRPLHTSQPLFSITGVAICRQLDIEITE